MKPNTEKKIKAIKALLSENDLLTYADELNLELLATQFDIYEDCLKDIEKNGLTIKDKQGSMKANPAANLLNKAMNTILVIFKDFGISAKSRKMLLKALQETDNEGDTPLNSFMEIIK